MGTPPCLFLAPGGSGGCPCPWLVGTSLQSLPLPSSLCVCSDFPLVRTPPIPLVGPAPILQTPSCFDLPRQRPRLQIGSHSRVRGGREPLGGPYSTYSGLPERLRGKESACQAGNMGWIPGSGRCPRGGDGSLLQCSCLGKSHGQRSLAGCSPWGGKAPDTIERLKNNKQQILPTGPALPV